MHDNPTAQADTIGSPGSAKSEATLEFARGTLINRYVILERLGAGGMGVVFAAYDPELRRRVALKFLHLDGANDDTRQARLLREAQSLARLSHPNVITVFDAGTHDGRVYITMEYIEGQTLRQWCETQHRTWRDILSHYIEAAHGLAAAHAAGLVHRDFKPENVLIDKNGHARVLDFGLARQVAERTKSHAFQSLDTLVAREQDAMEGHLTRPGALAGTPVYMAPEQLLEGLADEKSDQYSFCVSLYESIYGQRPFGGDTIAELIYNATNNFVDPRPPRSAAPKRLGRALAKGLAKAPTQRFASMKDLIMRLEHIQYGRAYRSALVATMATLVALASGYAYYLRTLPQNDPYANICTSSANALQGLWDESRKMRLKQAMERTGAPFAKDAWSRVLDELNVYTDSWVRMHTETCRATHIYGTQSDALLDLRMACFQGRLEDLRALVDVLERADTGVVARAAEGSARLPAVDRCTDATELSQTSAELSTPEGIAASREIRQQLSRSRAQLYTAQFAAGLESATAAVDKASALGDPGLLAESLLAKGWILHESSDQAASREAITSAFFKSIEAGNDTVATKCALHLITQNLGLETARQWIPHAHATIARISHRNSSLARQLEGELSISLGTVAVTDEDYSAAEEHYRKALDVFASVMTPDELGAGSAHNNLGNLLLRRGDTEGARDHIEASLQIYRRLLGSHHPSVGVALNNLGEIYMRAGRFSAADEVFAQAFAVFSAALEPKHPHIGVTHNNLGDVFQQTGKLSAAKEHYQAAIYIFESAFGAGAGPIAYPLTGMGEVVLLQGQHLAAIAILEKAMALPDIGDAALRARTHFALAQALEVKPAARNRVTELAEASRDAFVTAGPSYARELAEVERWLEARRGRRM